MPSQVHCPDCDRDFVFTSNGMRALYYHLKSDHAEDSESAYQLVDAAIDSCVPLDENMYDNDRGW